MPDSDAVTFAGAKRVPARVVRALALALPAAGAIAVVVKLVLDAFHPFALDYGEGIALDRALALARGEALYTPVDRPPFITWNFPPVYAWLCGGVAALSGPSFAGGRLLSLAATLAAAACLYRVARRESGRRWMAAVAACLFLGSRPVAVWGALMRVDDLGLAFGLGGLAAVSAAAHPVLAGVLFALASLCKQSLVAALGGALLYLLAARRRSDALVIAATYAAVVLGVMGWQAAATGGLVWRHVLLANMNSWSAAQLGRLAGEFAARHALLIGLAGAGAVLRPRGRPLSLAHAYLAAAGASALLAGKFGPGINYFLDLAAALAIAAAAGAPHLAALLNRRRPGAGDAVLAAVLAAHTLWATRVPEAAGRARAPYLRAALPLLASAPGPVISDDPGLVVAAGKPLWFQPFEFSQMATAGTWDPAPMLRALRAGEVALVALHFSPWDGRFRDRMGTWESGAFTDEMVAAMRDHYRAAFRCGPLWILQPLDTPEPSPAEPAERP